MTAASSAIASAGTTHGAGALKPRRRSGAVFGFTPFAVYILIFLAIPTVWAVASGFLDGSGAFTLHNFAAFKDPFILKAFWNSVWLSALVAAVSAVIGAVICVAMLGTKPNGLLRNVVDSLSSVFAQFGGVMLAFAFIALIGQQGLLTLWLQHYLHFDINDLAFDKKAGPLLYQVSGLIYPYLYFSIPLMVLSFMPALEGLKPQWGEAVATLGGGRFTYWLRVAFPVLAPAFFGSLILLFANAFSSFATAAALINSGVLVPLAMKQELSSETIPNVANTPGVLALGMIVIMVVIMWLYSLLQRRSRRWER
ncbi:ABC transporter permease subunit [Humibacter soli]